jgi:two-component system, NarL family, invasion response regulator UvrY
MITIAITDDHKLIRESLIRLLNTYIDKKGKSKFEVLISAENGVELLKKIKETGVPDVILLDINMPVMDGFETLSRLKKNYPSAKVLILSMMSSEFAIIKAFREGAKGYLLKNTSSDELCVAIENVAEKNIYLSEFASKVLVSGLNREVQASDLSQMLTEKEVEFLKHMCTDKSLKEIADEMFVSPRTIDAYKESISKKLNISSRVGLAMYAVKHGIVKL